MQLVSLKHLPNVASPGTAAIATTAAMRMTLLMMLCTVGGWDWRGAMSRCELISVVFRLR